MSYQFLIDQIEGTEIQDGLGVVWSPGGGATSRRWTFEKMPYSDNRYDLLGATLALINRIPNPPSFATPHPNPTLRNLYACDYNVQIWPQTSRNSTMLTAEYRTPSPGAPLGGICIDFAGSNGQWIKNRWESGPQKGKIILVGWGRHPDGSSMVFPNQIDPAVIDPTDGHTGLGNFKGAEWDTVQIPIENPNAVFTLTRMEFGTVQTPAIPPSFPFRRTVNIAPWLGFAAETVLLHDIQARYVFGTGLIPNHFVSRYIFEAAVDPMYIQYFVSLFSDPSSMKHIAGINILDGTNNGYTWVGLYPETDFNQLNFNFSGI